MVEVNKLKSNNSQVGLLPMDLAESNENDRKIYHRCFYPVLQKLVFVIVLTIMAGGIYILIFWWLECDDNFRNSEIIVLSELNENSNITLVQDDVEIHLRLRNKTSNYPGKRKKRQASIQAAKISASNNHNKGMVFDESYIQKARKIIKEHNMICSERNHEEICKDLVSKLRLLTKNAESDKTAMKEHADKYIFNNKNMFGEKTSTDISKRDTLQVRHDKSLKVISENDVSPAVLKHEYPREKLTDTCLLARLLKQSYPHLQGVYDNTNAEFASLTHPQFTRFTDKYAASVMNSPLYRVDDVEKHKIHPQDVEIAMQFFPKSEPTSLEHSSNSTTNDVTCPEETRPCLNGEACISENQWCDGSVDCTDISDEARCSCKSRVDKSRICDGYFDCPFGEDEMGCYGCNEDMFSCEDFDKNSQSTCFSNDQRCNNVADCPNHKDEIDCSLLAPSLHKKPLFAVSNTEGFLHRNFKGTWYPVCKNPYMWAHDACRRETGLIIRPPFIQLIEIDPLTRTDYLNTAPGGLMYTSRTCFNTSAVYVTCPNLLCGTRVLTSTQILRQNAAIESDLYGRNKRFLLKNRLYPLMFYSNRFKRLANNVIVKPHGNTKRTKRTESRVVGGRPSQPAAWPWVVALYRDGIFHCGGVIINQHWVMSAAHCVNKFWEHYYEIQVGMLRRFSFSPQEQNHRVTHVIVNQNYNQEDMKNDLSLLRVKPGIQFSRWVRPICLPGPETAGPNWRVGPEPGTICIAVGWGATVEHGPDPDHMREVEIPIWSHCKHEEDEAGKEICAGFEEGGKDACQGDSGGPLICKNPLNAQQWYVAGIVSHGDGCARKDEPGVYTRVSIFTEWIKFHILSNSLPSIQPKQECPGFRCESGITKCLPKKRMCDGIIDCLSGEDEISCDYKNLKTFSDNTLSESNDVTETKNGKLKTVNDTFEIFENKDANVKVSFMSTTLNTLNTVTEFDNLEIHSPKSEDTLSTVKQDINNSLQDLTSLENDFKHASTIEIDSTDTSEETSMTQTSNEHVTLDPIILTTNEILDTHTISINKPNNILETMSSHVKENSNEFKESRSSLESEDKTTTGTTPFFINLASSKNISNQILTINDEITTLKSLYQSTEQNEISTTNHEMDHITFSKWNNDVNTTENAFQVTLNQESQIHVEDHSSEHPTEFPKHLEETATNKNPTTSGLDKMTVNYNVQKLNESDVLVDEKSQNISYEIKKLLPAKILNQYRVPIEFQCRRINQSVPFNKRCDQKADCEDGTDEQDCTCKDYLLTFNKNLLCDGNFDCIAGQDELDCFLCSEDQFLCKKSQTCLPSQYVCDGIINCPHGEDEQDCFALSNGKEIFYEFDGQPKLKLDGFVSVKHKGDWQISCEDNLSLQQQEQTANDICHYLGFRSANRYLIKYINIREENLLSGNIIQKRRKRNVKSPVHFTYINANRIDEPPSEMLIKEPEVLKEQCVPNITKTCMTVYVFCDQSLFTNFHFTQEASFNQKTENNFNLELPWIAKIYVNGLYKCTGVLIDLSWVLVSHSCLWNTLFSRQYIAVILGSYKTLPSTIGPYEQIFQVDAKRDLYNSKVTLLRLNGKAKYSSMVKPMTTMFTYIPEDNQTVCIAVGEDHSNNTISVLLNETTHNCSAHNRCFVLSSNSSICSPNEISQRPWAGIISCHTNLGWYPAASFVDSRGECGISNKIISTDIGNIKNEMKILKGSSNIEQLEECEGQRCGRGRCIKLRNTCDGIRHCEDGRDESQEACEKKSRICSEDPHYSGCDCTVDQLKCQNGRCIPKELFKNGQDDCEDGTDEPGQTICSDYLGRVMPSRLCDGVLHCHDRSDENPKFCKCFAKHSFMCNRASVEGNCVAFDMVCDGIRDCPNGEDENTCLALSAPEGTPYGKGKVIVRSHGVWYTKCFSSQNHTKSQLEGICRQLGFISGHAKQLPMPDKIITHPHNNLIVDSFNEVVFNDNTKIKLRNTHSPIAKAVTDDNLKDCFPLFIECL
ncbi:unnamed protein product [Parnassius mnemosyne]|uniref:Serine protease nudel n=1 Tax=Parnassius mnemosyne TaxID=213953 RepID=A0AAV1LXG8_9NEOP